MSESDPEIRIEQGAPEAADVEMDWSQATRGSHRDVALQATPVHVDLPKRSFRKPSFSTEGAIRAESDRLKFADMEEILSPTASAPEVVSDVADSPSPEEARPAEESVERREARAAFADQSTVSFGVEHLLGGLPTLEDPDQASSSWDVEIPEPIESHEETRMLAAIDDSTDEEMPQDDRDVGSSESAVSPSVPPQHDEVLGGGPEVAPEPIQEPTYTVEVASIARESYMTTASHNLRDYVYNARRIGKTDPERAIRLLEVKRDELDEMKRVWVYGELACLHCRLGLKQRDRTRIRTGLGLLNKARICASDPESMEVERHFWNTLGPRMLQAMSFVDHPESGSGGADASKVLELEQRLDALSAQIASLVSSEHAGGRTRLERAELRLSFLDRSLQDLRKRLGRINDRYGEKNDEEGTFYSQVYDRRTRGETASLAELETYCRVLDEKLDVIVGALVHATQD